MGGKMPKMKSPRGGIAVLVTAALLALSCSSPLGHAGSPQPPTPQITVTDSYTENLTLSAYAYSPTSATTSALAASSKVLAGSSLAVSGFPADIDLQLKAVNDLSPSTIYTLTDTAGTAHDFRLSAQRTYLLSFSASATAGTTPMVWNWKLAANASYEVSGLSATPGQSYLFLTWKDPDVNDLVSINIKDAAGNLLQNVAKGTESCLVSDLAPGTVTSLQVTAVYPEIESQGKIVSGTPTGTPTQPAVLSTTPIGGGTGVSLTNPSITAQFSAPINSSTISSQTFTLSASGQSVPGTASCSGNSVSFTPSAALAPATIYTATLTTGVQSTAGLGLASDYSWSFTTAPAPTITSTTPTTSATGIDPSATPSVSFSQSMDASSLALDFSIADGSGAKVSGSVTVSGTTATFAPSTPLTYSTIYTATIKAGALSTAGAPLASDYSWTFTTMDKPLFQPAVFVSIASQLSDMSVAIGDLNGDGLKDVVVLTGSYNDVLHDRKVAVLLQDPGSHQLGAPTYYALSASGTPNPFSVAIGNFTGHTDGLNDIVVAENGLGIEVFKQNSAHVFTTGIFYASKNATTLAVGDFNGDGRTDIAGIGWSSSLIDVWLQQADGSLLLQPSVAVSTGGWDDLAAGDINGDGKTDLVAMSGSYYADPNLSLVTQGAGNLYLNSTRNLSTANRLTNGTAIGDLNGDGTMDIVVTSGGNRPDAQINLFTQSSSGVMSTNEVATYPSYDCPKGVATADLNGDGRTDVVVWHGGWLEIGVYLQTAAGTLGPETLYKLPNNNQSANSQSLAIGDLNADGKPDTVAVCDGGIAVFYQN